MTRPFSTWSTNPVGTDAVALTIRQGQTASVVWLGDLMQVMTLIKAFESVGCVAEDEGEHEGEQA